MKPENRPKIEFEGKKYDDYQATQMQRRIEREIRKQKRRKAGFEAAGLTDDAAAAGAKIRTLNKKYREFSKAAGLPEQRERMRVLYTDGLPSSKAKVSVDKSSQSGIIRTGAISGALDPNSERASEHAERYYESVRKMTTDVKRIAENTGYSESEIQRIKNFIFLDKHDLGGGDVERFASSYEMAESWQRLIDGKSIQPHDLTLLQHEMQERLLMEQGYTQDEAHIIASKKYNYAKEAYKFHHGKTD